MARRTLWKLQSFDKNLWPYDDCRKISAADGGAVVDNPFDCNYPSERAFLRGGFFIITRNKAFNLTLIFNGLAHSIHKVTCGRPVHERFCNMHVYLCETKLCVHSQPNLPFSSQQMVFFASGWSGCRIRCKQKSKPEKWHRSWKFGFLSPSEVSSLCLNQPTILTRAKFRRILSAILMWFRPIKQLEPSGAFGVLVSLLALTRMFSCS